MTADIALLGVVIAIPAYATSLGCRFALRRHRKPGWRQVALGIIVLDVLWCGRLLAWYLFQRREWNNYPVAMILFIPFTLFVMSIFGLIGAFPTTLFYRRWFKDDKAAV